jgi:hypothetical protein
MPIKANGVVCWEPTCDECGEGDNSEYGGSFHYESEAAAKEQVKDMGWEIDGDKLTCEGCLEERDIPSGSEVEDAS